jgi:hypothetical protein
MILKRNLVGIAVLVSFLVVAANAKSLSNATIKSVKEKNNTKSEVIVRKRQVGQYQQQQQFQNRQYQSQYNQYPQQQFQPNQFPEQRQQQQQQQFNPNSQYPPQYQQQQQQQQYPLNQQNYQIDPNAPVTQQTPPQSGQLTTENKPARQIDDALKPFDNAYKQQFLNQYPTQVDSSQQVWPSNHHAGSSQNWWNVDPNFDGFPPKSPFEQPYQQNAQGPQPVYQENVQPPNPQFFIPTTTRVHTTASQPVLTTTPYNYNYNQNYPNNNQYGNNYYPPNNSGYNPQWQNGNYNPNWSFNQNPNMNQQDYNSGIFQQFYRSTTTTDMPSITVKAVPDTYSKSFNPYDGMTERRKPVTPQVQWYSRYYDLTVPIAALPFNNYKNI